VLTIKHPLTIRRRTVSGALAEALARFGCLVPEELVLDGLLEDLRRTRMPDRQRASR